ncbi:MAG: Hsp20/alpha crystallin family protein [Deltaproteobacteria bacterium]|nr:Hsp20/alpha crystallin family protein [Deltaproteobacteria bacterium]
MFTRWGDFDNTIAMMDALRRRMEALEGPSRLLDDEATPPRVTRVDEGPSVVVRAELPGLAVKDVQVSVNQDVLTLAGERRTEAPAGYAVHRRERPSLRFSRSVALPCKVDAERATAVVKDGVLTVTLPKVPEAQARQIAVKAG